MGVRGPKERPGLLETGPDDMEREYILSSLYTQDV
jgi:hypothetical protein